MREEMCNFVGFSPASFIPSVNDDIGRCCILSKTTDNQMPAFKLYLWLNADPPRVFFKIFSKSCDRLVDKLKN